MENNPSQTLQERYPHLEVSILKLSEVQKDNESFRIDSEPFKKSNLHINTNLLYEKLSNIAVINPSKAEINNFSKDAIITFLSMQNLGNGFIHHREQGQILQFENGYTYFAENDILIAKITPCMEHGKCAIATDLGNGIGFGSTEFNVFRIRDSRFLTTFVFCYLNRDSIRRMAADNMVGTSGRQRVPTAFYEKLPIPILPIEFQQEIEKMVKDSHKTLEESKELYKKAEETLCLELGLDPKNPLQSLLDSKTNKPIKSPNISIHTLKESFLKTGRLDSEYYQSKFEDIEKFIKSYPNGYDSFLNIINNKDTNFTPKNNENYSYIELANISNNGNINEPISDLGKNLPTRARRIVSKGDVIISSIEGSLSSCALITQEFDKHLVSTGFFVLKSKLLNGETLLVMFKSQIFQEYLKKFPSGTILCAINKEELSKILIPKIDPTTQEKIAKYIQESFNLRKKSKQLLDNAKIKVEEQIQGKT
ncbi:restriction endonuclease subunit S [Campylobacter lari]|uniref:restriction endonuclease subunit S n=1 Tax=Campylobacter lari TaxID=201 RepID=UPI0011EB6AD0|nr:restriction endonuclease subunit S [Campylobacter lari]EAJ1270327.1 restriction endonuclease subunit S [Campylobacter lari]KAB0589006.1 restriction endonuclease subunit S [Campylobacter lari subsp. concheus]MPC00741.1 restriction endonuclease subunit S [Campylobacter lari]QEL07178.1 type I restriction/modification system, specificity subunit [Campylobacter lari subsp. concheus]